MATARREYFGKLLEPGLREIFYEQFNQIPSMISDLFNVNSTDNPYEEDVSIGTLGEFPEFQGTVEYDRMYQGYNKIYEFPEFAKGFKIERRLYDDERYNVINKRPQGQAISAARRRENDAAKLFINAFDSNYPGPDGKALCDEEHPSKAYEEAGVGKEHRSNKDTRPLNHSNLQETKNDMRDFRDDRGGRISVVPDTLLVPVILEDVAWELIESEKKVDTADNNPNIHYGKYRLIVWDYLDPGTDNPDKAPWFMIDSNYANMFLNWFDRVPLEFAMEEEFDTLVAKFRAYMRYNYGWSDWLWIFGNDPS